jgi:hypothetical protein
MDAKMELMRAFLSAAVPLRIMGMQENDSGGPTPEQIEACRFIAEDLGERGDLLLFGSPKKGESADLANKLAQSIAVLAFAPGGVDIFDMHFEAHAIPGKGA